MQQGRLDTMRFLLLILVYHFQTVNSFPYSYPIFYAQSVMILSDIDHVASAASKPPMVWIDCFGTIPKHESLFTICNLQMVGSKGADCPIPKPACMSKTNFCEFLVETASGQDWKLTKSCYFPHLMSPPCQTPLITCTTPSPMEQMFHYNLLKALLWALP